MVFCENCHCDIEESKFFLHQRFCSQSVKYCDKCKEAIPIEEFDEHVLNHLDEEYNKSQSNKSIEDKKSSSLSRIMSKKVGCKYCEYLCSYEELEEHENACGSRTRECPQCGSRVMYKDYEKHLSIIHRRSNISGGEDENFDKNRFKSMTSEEQLEYAIAASMENNNQGGGNKVPGIQKKKSKTGDILKTKLSQGKINRMSEEEQIAYALAQSELDYNYRGKESNPSNGSINYNFDTGEKETCNQMTEKGRTQYEKKNTKKIKKKGSKKIKKKESNFDYTSIENELERQIYEEEYANYGNEMEDDDGSNNDQ